MQTSRRTFVAAVLGTAAAGLVGVPPVAAAAVEENRWTTRAVAGSSADNGARVVAEEYVGRGMLDLSIASPALADTVKARLLLPPKWKPHTGRSWPVLYLLHGGRDDYTSWTRETDVAVLTEHTDVLVVMPTAGRVGFYSDWWNHGAGGPPKWETFHLLELRQILERNYGAGSRRAIAGLSMGGFGALSYAARHPDMFQSAASYSGAVHTTYDAPRAPAIFQAILAAEGHDPLALWGDHNVHADIWAAHNPYDLAHRLLGIPLYVSSGNGEPGPLDPPRTQPDLVLERLIGEMSEVFVRRLHELGADLTANLYGPGTHTWPYWERELHNSFPMLMKSISARTRPPGRTAA